jgi:hypothetical protein
VTLKHDTFPFSDYLEATKPEMYFAKCGKWKAKSNRELVLLPVSKNYTTVLYLLSCASETWFYVFSLKKD